MGRGGRHSAGDAPERRCIATGATLPKAQLVRFVVGPDNRVVPDVLNRLPGRGIWVSPDRAAITRAAEKRLFSRAARQPVETPEGLADLVEAALARRMIELISLARKAGSSVAGYEKVKGWLEDGTAAVLLQAADGSERGKAKLRPPGATGAHVAVLTAQELGLAFGRENVIHGALRGGGLAGRVVEEAARLTAMRGLARRDRPVGKDTTTT